MTLPGRLIVSLTSYPPRYSQLRLVLNALLGQTHKPDEIVLWLTLPEWEVLPEHIRHMSGIRFAPCADFRSYKNIIPALAEYPDAYIAICADDVIYPPSWLKRFAEEYRNDREILCQYGKVVPVKDGVIGPYNFWPKCLGPDIGPHVFPGGFRGVMYPPGSLGQEVMNVEAFMRLCPHGDDIWKYWMGLRAGSTHRYIVPEELFVDLVTGEVGLWSEYNAHGGNDRQIAAMVEAYGMPWGKVAEAAE